MKVMHLIYSDTMSKTSTTIPTEWKEFMNIDAQKTHKKEVDLSLPKAINWELKSTETIL